MAGKGGEIMKYLILQTSRKGYSAEQAEEWESALTVGELIEVLNGYNKDLKVYFDNDNGYTYGSVTEDCIDEEEEKEYEDDEDD